MELEEDGREQAFSWKEVHINPNQAWCEPHHRAREPGLNIVFRLALLKPSVVSVV